MTSIINKLKNTGQNNKIIIKNTLGAFAIKGTGLFVSLVSTPALIRYFNNNEVLGIWFTMLSVLIWFLNFDLGIGNGIRNQLTKDFILKDEISAKITISSGFFSISIVSILLIVIGIVGISFIDLNCLFNVSSDLLSARTLRIASIAIFIAIMLRFMLTFVGSIFYSLQKSAFNNLLNLVVHVLQLVYVLVFHFQNLEDALISLAVSYVFITNLPMIIAGLYVFAKPLKNCRPSIAFINIQRVKQIVGIGTVFFTSQILYMIIVNTNEFLVTKLYGASYTAEYSFYYKVTNIVAMLVALGMTPIWSVVTKALTEKNYVWLNKLYVTIKRIGLLIVFFQFLLVPFMQFVMDFWLGKGIITIRTETALVFAVFGSVFAISTMLSTIVCGMARMQIQIICYAVGVVLKLVVDFSLYTIYTNWDLIVWSNVLVLLPYIVIQIIDLDIFFKKHTKLQGNEDSSY